MHSQAVVCPRVADCPIPKDGSVKRTCCQCGRSIWFGGPPPTLLDGPFSLICVQCGPPCPCPACSAAREGRSIDVEIEIIKVGSMAELVEFLRGKLGSDGA